MFGRTSGNDVPAFLGGDTPVVAGARFKETWYFIGFMLCDKDGILKNPINVKGRAYTMPKLGSAFEVDSLTAHDIADRLSVYDEKLGWVAGATRDAMVAQAVLAAFKTGNLKTISNLNDIIQVGTLNSLSDAALLAEIERRKAVAQVLSSETKSETPDEVTGTKATAKVVAAQGAK